MPVARLRPISPHVAAVDLHGRFQVAAFLVRHAGGLLLVDAGFPGWGFAILTAATSLPAPTEITDVILTNAHADHIGGTPEIVEHTGARVLSSVLEKPYIEGASLAAGARGLLPKIALTLNHLNRKREVPSIAVDTTLQHGDVLHGLEVIAIPGHTPGQIALLHRADGLLLSSDALFNVSEAPSLDPVPGMTADRQAARESLAVLQATGIEDLAPTHGPAILGRAQEVLGTLRDQLG
jgi:glyoxylase-like metal-dependent hydrolase (beta-lactamase superfamily II)